MAAAITTNSDTLEGQCIEILMAMQAKELDAASNPNGTNNVNGTFNSDTGNFNSTINLPFTITLNASGQPEMTATPYLEV